MPETRFRNRRAVSIENDRVRLTVLVEGGHIAELLDKKTQVNPLWQPPWPTMEPSTYDLKKHPEYGHDSESRLLSGIMGHNLCLDLFGGPSDEEAAAGVGVHGEGSVVPYRIQVTERELTAAADLPLAGLRVERRIRLSVESPVARISETVENLNATDRPIAWTQHVTLGPPFVEPGKTEFRAPGTRSKTAENDFSGGKGYMPIGADFDWPYVPKLGGGLVDMRRYVNLPVSAAFTTHLLDPHREQAFFVAWSPSVRVLTGYVWKRSDFPWLGIWEENHSRTAPPWNGRTLTRGMEFGASPMPETRRAMIERRSLFGVPGYRWLGAKQKAHVEYCAFIMPAGNIPENAEWDGEFGVKFT
jgi:hypothetical protein